MTQPVRDYYNDHVALEWERLEGPLGAIELASTFHLIERYFQASGHILDLASGPGRYAVMLGARGYKVTLIDIAEQSLAFAQERLAEAGLAAEAAIVADAQDLSAIPDNSFDAALCLGPMYHITEAEGRVRALRELRRVLRPEAPAIVAYLNSWGLLRTGITDFPQRFEDRDFLDSMLGEVTFPESIVGWTACHWSTPPAAMNELGEAGLEIISYAAAEGCVGGLQPLIEKLAATNPTAYGNLVKFAALNCELPQYRDTGDHLHFVVRRPTG